MTKLLRHPPIINADLSAKGTLNLQRFRNKLILKRGKYEKTQLNKKHKYNLYAFSNDVQLSNY